MGFLARSGTCARSGEWQPDQVRAMDEFGTVVITLDHLAKHWDHVWLKKRRIKVLKRSGLFFQTLFEILVQLWYLWKLWRVAA